MIALASIACALAIGSWCEGRARILTDVCTCKFRQVPLHYVISNSKPRRNRRFVASWLQSMHPGRPGTTDCCKGQGLHKIQVHFDIALQRSVHKTLFCCIQHASCLGCDPFDCLSPLYSHADRASQRIQRKGPRKVGLLEIIRNLHCGFQDPDCHSGLIPGSFCDIRG